MQESDARERLLLWLHYAAEHYTAVSRRVMEAYPDLAEAYAEAGRKNDRAFSMVPPRIRERLFLSAQPGFMDIFSEGLRRKKITAVTIQSGAYPELLKTIHDPPTVLFVRGKLIPMSFPLSVVGTRSCTPYGKTVAESFGRAFAQRGAAVVSGLAYGIDGHAARGALSVENAAFPTVAVLGTGVDVVYPAENQRLYEEIVQRGAVVSEFLPGVKGKPEYFPIRNRIISGLSLGTVVVEAGERSGASITAGLALEQGRDVFAVPGRITDPQSVGANRMIQQGSAKPVFCPEDVLVEYPDHVHRDSKGDSKQPPYPLSDTEQRVYEALERGEQSCDELAERTGIPIGALNSCLTAMEFSEIIKQLPGRLYAVDARRPVEKR